jgi:hypothetical protein
MLGYKRKNRHHWRFVWIASDCSCNCVNLPLLHRQGAGMAKVKMAAKENVLAHGGSVGVEVDHV